MNKGKSLIRSLNRKGARANRKPPVASKTAALREPACCERCGAVFARQTWRRDRRVTHALLQRVHWTVCPACTQTDRGEYFGRVLVRGAFAAANEEAIRRRIENVEQHARFTQPQRRLVSVERDRHGLEVLTTSQKLAHRIVRELKKLFRGRASYAWSDDGSLFATWQRDDVPAAPRQARHRA
jgi:NMD protein affecting ribosome stability and mRNA decay